MASKKRVKKVPAREPSATDLAQASLLAAIVANAMAVADDLGVRELVEASLKDEAWLNRFAP